jgi:hypothetical protein
VRQEASDSYDPWFYSIAQQAFEPQHFGVQIAIDPEQFGRQPTRRTPRPPLLPS